MMDRVLEDRKPSKSRRVLWSVDIVLVSSGLAEEDILLRALAAASRSALLGVCVRVCVF